MMFLCATTDDPDDGVDARLDQLLRLDPTLREVLRVPAGLRAHRYSRDHDWEIEVRGATAELGVLTSRPVAEGREPVRIVVHDHEGDRQCVCGTTNHCSDAVILGLNHLLDVDPALEELLDLPEGMRASRREPGEPWQFEPYEPGRVRAWFRNRVPHLGADVREGG